MAFKLIARNTVNVPVRGTLKTDDGKSEPFDFTLLCRRMGADALREELKDKERSVKGFMASVTEGWRGVKDGDGAEVEFCPERLDELLDTPGVAALAYESYLQEQAAKAKN